jgi:sortase A
VRLIVAKEPLKLFLRWTQRALLAIAASMLAYCGYVLIDAWNFQKTEQRQFEGLLVEGTHSTGGKTDGVTRLAASGVTAPPASGGLIGRIEIPRLGVSVIVIEGTGRTTLRRAAGHIPGTALPGQPGNVGISGHRDTFFRPLRNIRQNDIITVATLAGEYRYRVVFTMVVGPNDVAVLDPGRKEILTLVTCYPFYFVGAAPDRFIVRAERVT